VLLAVALAACDRLPGKPQEADRPLRPSEVTDVGRLYGENCAGCHGAGGRDGAALPMDHPVYLALVDDAALRKIIAAGVADTAMPAFARSNGGLLTDAQVELLVEGMRAKWATPDALGGATAPPWAVDGAGNATRGAGVYATFCARCHGPDGQGSAPGGSIVDGSYLALVSAQSLRTIVVAGRPDLGHPDWRGYVPGRAMTSQEVSDVVAWLVAQRPALPGRPYPAGGTS
jgi:cytochrome c oxidase cbb3-type subunit 3/ubiquinol-cytochrome c reductase cytochrome c subunit